MSEAFTLKQFGRMLILVKVAVGLILVLPDIERTKLIARPSIERKNATLNAHLELHF